MNTSDPAFDSFGAAAQRQTGRYGDKPFLTWYDDRREQRVELSYKTFDNWVAKTANLLVDELGAQPGDRVGLALAGHWQAPAVLAACWRVGTGVVVVDPAGGQQAPARAPTGVVPAEGLVAAFVGEEHLATAGAGGTVLVAVTADLLGRGEHDLGGALNFARVVPAMADVFAAGTDPDGDALTVLGPGPGPAEAATMGELLGRAAALAARTRLTDADRMLSGLPLLTVPGAVAGLLAPLACGAGVVLVGGLEPGRFWKRVADERVAVAVLDPGQAAAVLAAGPPPAGLDRSRLRVVACQGAGEALAAQLRAALGVAVLDA